MGALDACHVTLTAELRDEERGRVLASFDVEPEVVHHGSRDACVMRLAGSPSDVMREAAHHGCLCLPLTLRGKDAAPLALGEQLYFEGFEVQEDPSEDGDDGEDTRALVPLRSEGRLSISSTQQAFAETATVLPLGMCGSPVMCVATGEAIGMVALENAMDELAEASGIDPVDRAAAGGLDVDAVRQLVEHSTQVGALEETYRSPLAGVIDLQTLAIGDLVRSDVALTAVAQDATVGDIHTVAAESGHMRILVLGADAAPRVVHVRDVLLDPAAHQESPTAPAPAP